MASSSQNNPLTYMDGISVKIAENYKPPKRIPMVMSYSQRVALNKLIQEPMLTYDFSREESVKNKLYEWKKARTAVIEQRKQRLNQLTQAMNTKSWESNETLTENEVLDNKDSIKSDTISDNNQDSSRVLKADQYYQTESGILIPKIFNTQQPTKILTPIPLTNPHKQSAVDSRDFKNYSHKNPINYSEFESDTSSPFDNMELKIINDLEELAQVLKYDSDDNVTSNSSGASQQNNYVTTYPKTHKFMSNYLSDSMSSNLDNRTPIYGLDRSVNTKKFPPNGYYYDNYSQNALTAQITRDTGIRSVPEIMKSLQDDLASNTLSDSNSKVTASREASVASTSSNEILEDPFKSLSADLQKMSLKISSMGFPLPRVARACQLLEGNQKKIVEHLLAMSELLDLGFTEENVATALLKCENDRDKALDLLIT